MIDSINFIDGGITAPLGFRAAGVACGIKSSGLDLALIASDTHASAAGLFTTNRVQAAPVLLSRRHLDRSLGNASAVVVNSGCANACTGDTGEEIAREMARQTAQRLGCPIEQVLVASTGVIGVTLDAGKVTSGIASAASALSRDGHSNAARAIMTTDRSPKEAAVQVSTSQGPYRVGGMAKGAGMIEPMLATMLGFVTMDAQVEPAMLRRALSEAVDDTFNAITIDGECSTNDCVLGLANGASGVRVPAADYELLINAIRAVCETLALGIVRGGEGATKLVSVRVIGALSSSDARRAARVIANSPLVKTAVHGGDPNWGRLIAAAGRSGVPFVLSSAAVRIGDVLLFDRGRPYDERAPAAASHLCGGEIQLEVDMGAGGPHSATMWTCDLSPDYVKINAEYRT